MEHRQPALLTVRRLDPTRMALAIGLGASLLVGLGIGGSWAARGVVAWLHVQPPRQLTFRQIGLAPDPPSWVRSGRIGLLDRIRDKARPRWDEPFSVLDVDLKAIDQDFRLYCPWVKRVKQVRRSFPARLVVEVEYREPVARVVVGRSFWVVDEEGCTLPMVEIDPAAAGPLIPILDRDLRFNPASDQSLTVSGELNWLYNLDRNIREAARLAAFLKRKQGQPRSSRPPLEIVKIVLKDAALYLGTREGTWVRWGKPPRNDSEVSLTADQKWERLRQWVARHGSLSLEDPQEDFLDFDRDQLRVLHGRRPSPNRTEGPGTNRSGVSARWLSHS